MPEPVPWHPSLHKTLRMPGLKPSDYRLFCQTKDYFALDMRQAVVLGLRWLYAGFHEPRLREMILKLAAEVKFEDLDYQGDQHVTYTPFAEILAAQEVPKNPRP